MNKMSSSTLNFLTPLQKKLSSYVQIPILLNLAPKIFSCTAYVHVPKGKRTKLELCAIKCIFLGYRINQKGYKCYHPELKRVYVTMDVTFLEGKSYFQNQSPDYSFRGGINKELNGKKFWWIYL